MSERFLKKKSKEKEKEKEKTLVSRTGHVKDTSGQPELPILTSLAAGSPMRSMTRDFISFAALVVKVMRMILVGRMFMMATRKATRWQITLVFPVTGNNKKKKVFKKKEREKRMNKLATARSSVDHGHSRASGDGLELVLVQRTQNR